MDEETPAAPAATAQQPGTGSREVGIEFSRFRSMLAAAGWPRHVAPESSGSEAQAGRAFPMTDAMFTYGLWALLLGAVSAVSLPLGSVVGLNVRFPARHIAAFAAFGAGALIAALSVELVAPTALALTEASHTDGAGHALANFAALLVGGAIGGVLFVALDAVVNKSGGYVRKTSTALAHTAARRREEVRKVMQGVLEVRPFDALPVDMAPALASVLRPVTFGRDEIISGRDRDLDQAYIVLEGELDVEIGGRHGETIGPGTFIRCAGALRAGLASLPRQDEDRRQVPLAEARRRRPTEGAVSGFDQACRDLAGERMDQLEQHLTTRLHEAVEWTRVAAGALRLGAEVPALVIRRAHAEQRGSPLAVWLGILLDGIPESMVIGAGLYVTLVAHPAIETLRFAHVIPYTLVAGLFLSNFPEALSSSANMLVVGWTRRRIFLMWFALMVTTAVGAGLGFLLATVLSETWLVFAEGLAAGAMLTMIAAAMIPEAAVHGRPSTVGLCTLAGFLAAVLFKLLE
jgi:zinc transporter ZupT